jgi:hypothetical protein
MGLHFGKVAINAPPTKGYLPRLIDVQEHHTPVSEVSPTGVLCVPA